MFDIELMNFNPGAPTFLVMLITAFFAFFLSSLIAITYEFTTKSIYRKGHFLQSLALISIASSTILQAIGESVAIGLGILGALSIIRFRTSFADSRNISFMFASLAAGIASGVMGFGIALTGTIVFCGGAVLLRFSSWANDNELIGQLKLRVPREDHLQKAIELRLKEFCTDFELERLRFFNSKKSNKQVTAAEPGVEGDGIEAALPLEMPPETLQEFVYLIRLKNSATITALEARMRSIEGLKTMQLDFQKQPTKL